jgi:phosphosulfolactate synthase
MSDQPDRRPLYPSADEAQPMSALEDRAFAALRIPSRAAKPRSAGQTIVADRGLGTRAQADLLEVGGDFVDWVKLCSTSPRLLATELLERKIRLYREARVAVFVTGDGFELATAQGVADQLYAEATAIGCEGFEVASAQVILALDAKASLVRRVAAAGLRPFAEVGRKGRSEIRANVPWMLREIDTLIEAGAYRIVVQGEGIVEDVDAIDEDLLYAIAARFGTEWLVFQAKDARAQQWFIEHLGPDTNLDVESHHVITLELARRGLAKRGLTGLVAGSPDHGGALVTDPG